MRGQEMTQKSEFTWQDFAAAIDKAVDGLTGDKAFDGRVLLQGVSAFAANVMSVMKDDSLLTTFIGEVISDYLHFTGRCGCGDKPEADNDEMASAIREAKLAVKN